MATTSPQQDTRPQARETRCVCARNTDGSRTTMLCSAHADWDPCATMSAVTGKRRKGTIRRGTCTSCGWSEVRASSAGTR